MAPISRQRGLILALALVMMGLGLLLGATLEIASLWSGAMRDRASDRALLQAREALLAYAADRAISPDLGPGYLPCPDLDDDGWAESTCGSLAGDVGQSQRLGRLPWKTLGLPDLRDGDGERLWYAVSTKYKGLLNCQASTGCVDMTPDAALGTITVRDASGAVLHDGTLGDPLRATQGGAVAVVIAPGAALLRAGDGARQQRDCALGDCDPGGRCVVEPPQRAARCDPRNYLDVAMLADGTVEDNADFIDRSSPSSRAGNGNGFIMGPVRVAARLAVNDRLVAIGHGDIAPRVMARVAAEVAYCLREYAAQGANAGRIPWAAPTCAADAHDTEGTTFGRIPQPPFSATHASSAAMAEQWPATCNLAAEDGWWKPWRRHVFYALADAASPSGSGTCSPGACLAVEDPTGAPGADRRRFAVLVGGPPLHVAGMPQDHGRLDDPRQWLEGTHAAVLGDRCATHAPARYTAGPRTASFNDVVLAAP